MSPRSEQEPLTPAPSAATKNNEDVDAFAEQVFNALLGAQQIQASWLGDKLGWYQCLAQKGPLTPAQLAEATTSSERYAREWCEHQTVSGWITCQDPTIENRTYFLSSAQEEVLVNQDSLAHLLPLCKFTANLGRHVDKMKCVYKNDGGISWDELGDDARDGCAEANRPMFLQQLGQQFLPVMPEVDAALKNGGRVADIGAGMAWSSIGVAQAYPHRKVDVYDLDEPSIVKAQRNIAAAGLNDRISAKCVDAGKLDENAVGPYDLVMALECIHDMGDSVSVLSTMKKLAGEKGTVMVMDEKVKDKFNGGDTNDPVEQFVYGASLTCCLADCKSHPNSAATGAVMRPSQLEWYAIEAGFRGVEILPIKHDFFYFYKLKLHQ